MCRPLETSSISLVKGYSSCSVTSTDGLSPQIRRTSRGSKVRGESMFRRSRRQRPQETDLLTMRLAPQLPLSLSSRMVTGTMYYVCLPYWLTVGYCVCIHCISVWHVNSDCVVYMFSLTTVRMRMHMCMRVSSAGIPSVSSGFGFPGLRHPRVINLGDLASPARTKIPWCGFGIPVFF